MLWGSPRRRQLGPPRRTYSAPNRGKEFCGYSTIFGRTSYALEPTRGASLNERLRINRGATASTAHSEISNGMS